MTDPEREHFVRRIHDLERRLRRWRLACLALLGLLLLPVVLGGLLGVAWVPQLERQRARLQAEQTFYQAQIGRAAAEMQAKAVAEEALQRAEGQRAEEEARRQAQQGPGEDKP
jgi:triphosphoribosyl-dephospho-CoA synthetase